MNKTQWWVELVSPRFMACAVAFDNPGDARLFARQSVRRGDSLGGANIIKVPAGAFTGTVEEHIDGRCEEWCALSTDHEGPCHDETA
jgi:hypothetical protein